MAEKSTLPHSDYVSDDPEQDWENFEDNMRHILAVKPPNKDPMTQGDLIEEREKVVRDNPGLEQSYKEFQASYAKFREVEKQFKGKDNQANAQRLGMRFRI